MKYRIFRTNYLDYKGYIVGDLKAVFTYLGWTIDIEFQPNMKTIMVEKNG